MKQLDNYKNIILLKYTIATLVMIHSCKAIYTEPEYSYLDKSPRCIEEESRYQIIESNLELHENDYVTYQGKIVDGTGRPIKQTEIHILNGWKRVYSNENGDFILVTNNLDLNQQLRFSKSGYSPLTLNHSKIKDRIITVTLNKEKKSRYEVIMNELDQSNLTLYQLIGRVTDCNNEILSYAQIFLLGSQIGTITDSIGNFNLITNEKFEEHSIIVSYTGCKELKIDGSIVMNSKIKIRLAHTEVLYCN